MTATAVSAADGDEAGVRIETDPPGAQVTLEGEATVSGISPVVFRLPLIGDYKLKVEKFGWEGYNTQLILDPRKNMTVNVSLSPKTRFKAAVRSFFIPGWGQTYTGQKNKGALLLLATIGSGAAYLILDNKFDDKFDTFESRRDEYDSLLVHGTQSELDAAWQRLANAQDEAYDAENRRRVAIGAVVASWAINMLDILFFFPAERGTFSVKGVAVKPQPVGDGFGVTLSAEF